MSETVSVLLQGNVDPAGIERRSMEIIEAEVPAPRPFSDEQWLVVRRMIHASADFEVLDLVAFHPEAVAAGVAALRAGSTIVTDTNMALAGIPRRRLEPLGCAARCLLDDPEVVADAAARGVTRALAAMDKTVDLTGDLILVIGNAPTALLRCLELMAAGRLRPRLIIGMPVGFVNAAESKYLLMRQEATPYITLQGRKGGSSLAAAACNALADMALGRE